MQLSPVFRTGVQSQTAPNPDNALKLRPDDTGRLNISGAGIRRECHKPPQLRASALHPSGAATTERPLPRIISPNRAPRLAR